MCVHLEPVIIFSDTQHVSKIAHHPRIYIRVTTHQPIHNQHEISHRSPTTPNRGLIRRVSNSIHSSFSNHHNSTQSSNSTPPPPPQGKHTLWMLRLFLTAEKNHHNPSPGIAFNRIPQEVPRAGTSTTPPTTKRVAAVVAAAFTAAAVKVKAWPWYAIQLSSGQVW